MRRLMLGSSTMILGTYVLAVTLVSLLARWELIGL